MPLEWRVENGDGTLICPVYDSVTAEKIAAALDLAEKATAGADSATLAEALERCNRACLKQLLY